MQTHILCMGGVWRKTPQRKLNLAKIFQYGLYAFPILRPTFSKGLLSEEAVRLRRMHEAGLSVPKVISASDHLLVTEDVGVNLESLISREPEKSRFYVEAAADALVLMHKSGFVHGRPFLRDMTFKDGKVYFLDLEESPLASMPLSVAQVRDLLLFVFSLERLGYADIPAAVLRFLAQQGPRFLAQLEKQLALLSTLTSPLALIPRRLSGKDVRVIRSTLADTARAALEWKDRRQKATLRKRQIPVSAAVQG